MKHQMGKQLHKNTSKNSAWSCVKGKSASHSAKAHDSSTGLNTIHYTKVGFPIFVQGQALGASQLGKAVLFPWGEVILFRRITTPSHPNSKPSPRLTPQINGAVARTPSEQRPSKTKRPARGCQAESSWVKRARLAPQAECSGSLLLGRNSRVLRRAPRTLGKVRKWGRGRVAPAQA